MDKRIKILFVLNDMERTGIGQVVMNYLRYINRDVFDIEVACALPIVDVWRDELEKLKIKIHLLPNLKTSTIQFYFTLFIAMKKGRFDIVEVQGNSATMAIALTLAKITGIKHRIAHCHNSKSDNMYRHKKLMPLFLKVCTVGFACSKLAGNWIFGENNFAVIKNGFDVERFRFNAKKREFYRIKLGLEDKVVLIHIGCLNSQKNHAYLLKIFEKWSMKNKNSFLLLIGTGPFREALQTEVDNSPYADRILFYGDAEDVSGLLSAADVFAFPSIHEGFGIVAVEAQLSGLPCVVSTAVPMDVVVGSKIDFLPIADENIDQWVSKIELAGLSLKNRADFFECNEAAYIYDIQQNVKELEEKYMQIYLA